MSEISSDICQLTQHLNALLKKLTGAGTINAAQLIDETLTLEVLTDFKRSTDAMRHLLWTYIQAASYATSGDLNDPIHGPRLRRATEVLQGLREAVVPKRLLETIPFGDHVEALAAYYAQGRSDYGN